jgi:hypothetical protein
MTTKTKNPTRAAPAHSPLPGPLAGPSQMPPCTMEERLQRIEAMGKRITGFVQFMCQVGNMNGTSAEAKEIAVLTFYEKMVVLEHQLGRIHDDFKLE